MGVGKTAKGAKRVHRTAEYTDHGIEAVPSQKKSKGATPGKSRDVDQLTGLAVSLPFLLIS